MHSQGMGGLSIYLSVYTVYTSPRKIETLQ